ncbi:uncharacterized protein LOC142176387 [Nicotiana tabacum]|uniref:Uncharacterized protein LOC142176387 n=1 Tax=Nicotiana tabacum TaxID=4097 RepID=A0AC58TRZ7_TOBAC
MWVNELPFKIAFFMWKIWKGKLPLDDYFRRLGYFMPSKCWCCSNPDEETTTHVFFRSYAARATWSYFLTNSGIAVEGLSLQQAILKCWTLQVLPRIKPIFQALPSIILWELWKRCNSYKHVDSVSVSRVIYQISSTLQALVKVRKPSIKNVPHKWPDLLKMLEHYTPSLKVTKVLWELPNPGWVKVNTDGVSRGNPGRSSIGFVIRDEEGDVKYALGKETLEVTNSVAEAIAIAIAEALKYCVEHGYTHILLQTNSMMLKNVIEGKCSAPWSVIEYVEEIKEIIQRWNVSVLHIMREGNQLADHLANYALDVGGIEAHNFEQLEVQGRKIVNSDKFQCPYLRIRVARS